MAQYTEDGSDAIVLKELVAKNEATTGSTIKENYPYWLADAEGNAYTHGAKGSEFVESFDLKMVRSRSIQSLLLTTQRPLTQV